MLSNVSVNPNVLKQLDRSFALENAQLGHEQDGFSAFSTRQAQDLGSGSYRTMPHNLSDDAGIFA